ncbi:hypothetical protein [Mesorhizobium sp. CAU 1741]|uniref:hypothetical protein n=1 Tax=Mesorhizobium sp. CAU 1741 TaxID=3140366 RepID=UPI00325AB69C
MISFKKKDEPAKPLPVKDDENRFEQIRKAAKDGHRKSDTDGTRRRDRQTADDNKLI